MKKLILFLSLLLSVFVDAQSYRYLKIPEGGGPYLVPNAENKTITYSATVALAPTHIKTVFNVSQLTGALTLTTSTVSSYIGDDITILFVADGTDRTVTFSTNFSAAGTFTVPASTHGIVKFTFTGSAWYETSRQNLVSGSVTTLLAGNGTAGAPSISFTSDTDVGLYHIGSNNLGVSVGGTKALDVSSTGLGVTGNIVTSTANVKKNTATAYTTTSTVTAIELAGGLLTVTSGTLTLTLPTATDAGTQFGAGAGTVVDFVVLNAASGGTVTIAVNTGITASGFPSSNTLTLAPSSTVGVATFRLTFISSTVATLTRTS